jgi:hypothetical protein
MNRLYQFEVSMAGDLYSYDCQASIARMWLWDNNKIIKEDFIVEVHHDIHWGISKTIFCFRNK